MAASILLQVGGLVLFGIAVVLWLDSPTGQPRDGKRCYVRGCRWH